MGSSLAFDGLFTEGGAFVPAARFHAKMLSEIFRHEVLKMLLARGAAHEEVRLVPQDGTRASVGPRPAGPSALRVTDPIPLHSVAVAELSRALHLGILEQTLQIKVLGQALDRRTATQDPAANHEPPTTNLPYEVDPLICPECQATMRAVAFIDDEHVIRQILEHLGLWLADVRAHPRAHSPPTDSPCQQDPACQLPEVENDLCQLPPPEWEE